jgi:hypothetical protein
MYNGLIQFSFLSFIGFLSLNFRLVFRLLMMRTLRDGEHLVMFKTI